MSRPGRDTTAGRVYLDLQARAREEGRPTGELLVLYVHERLLFRVGRSSHRSRLILKGGMLLAALEERRPTRDVDLLAQAIDNDIDAVSDLVRDVLAVTVDDGVEYDVGRMQAKTIRDIDPNPGVRIVVPASIHRAREVLRVDVNIGDPVTPAPVELAYPSLLGEPFTLLGYPIETVLAEKIVTMIDRGDATTRERDFADVVTLIRRHEIGAQRLRAAIDATAEHRESILRPLREVLVTLGDERQSDWTRYVAGAGLVDLVPQSFADAIDAVADFADPILTGAIGEVRVPHGVPRAAGPSQAFPSRGGLYPARLCPDCAWAQSAPRLRHRSCRWGDVAVTNNSSVVSTVGATAAVGESAIGSTPAPS